MHHGLWRTGRESLAQAKQDLCEVVAAELGEGARSLLDIGCGYGKTGRIVALLAGSNLVGITNSAAQHERAVRSSGKTTSFLLGDWIAMQLPDTPFDAAIAIESLEHFTDRAAFFAKAHAALQPGGRFVLAGWHAGGPSVSLARIASAARMPSLVPESETLRLAATAGFQVLKAQDLTAAVSPTWWHMGAALLRRPRCWRHGVRHWRFAMAALRICAAFRTGALRYAVITLAAR